MCNSVNTYACDCESCRRLTRFWSLRLKVVVEVPKEFDDDYLLLVLDELDVDEDRFVVSYKRV